METIEIEEKSLYEISVYDPNDPRLGMRVHVVADDHHQATEKAQAFFRKKHIHHSGLRNIKNITSQCVV